MGTTLVACLLDERGKGVIANVGDSRAYLIDNEICHTKDHSYVQELIDAGVISEEEALKHPMKNIISRAVGVEEEIKIDFYYVDIASKILLLCSDGLHDYISAKKISEIVKTYSNPEKAARKLVKEALRAGSEDNITVIICRNY